MSKLQQEAIIRKEGYWYEIQKAKVKELWDKATAKEAFEKEQQTVCWEYGFLLEDVEQPNEPRLRRMWQSITKFFTKLYFTLPAKRGVPKAKV